MNYLILQWKPPLHTVLHEIKRINILQKLKHLHATFPREIRIRNSSEACICPPYSKSSPLTKNKEKKNPEMLPLILPLAAEVSFKQFQTINHVNDFFFFKEFRIKIMLMKTT